MVSMKGTHAVVAKTNTGVILVILDAEIVYYICKLGTNVGRKD